VRRLLYVAAAALVVVVAIVGRNPRAGIVFLLAVGGFLTSLGANTDDEPSSQRLAVMGGFDILAALVLAGLGMVYSSLLVLVGAIAALSLLRPQWGRTFAPGAGLAGAAAAYLSVNVAGVQFVISPDVVGPAFSLFVVMAAVAVISAGLAWIFGSIGARLADLTLAQQRTRQGIDDRPVPVLVVDGDTIMYANPAAIVYVGQALAGESMSGVFGIPGPLAGNQGFTMELETSGDTAELVDVSVQPITFDGRPLTQVALEVSGAEATPNTVRGTAPRRLDLLFDRIPVAVYRSAVSGEVLAANSALADMLGLSDPTELLGTVERAHAHYQDRGSRAEWLAKFDETDVVMDYEIELTKADGSTIIVTDSSRAIRDRDGAILFFEGVLVDVTEQRRIEEARRRTSEILEATSDLVWLTDADDRIDRLNAAMRSFLSDGEGSGLIGAHVSEFITSNADAAALKAWRESLDGPAEWRGEISLQSRAGKVILASAVAQRHRHFISIVARDITEERQTARQLAELVAGKDEFIASVSHELRTPLTAVVGLASELATFYDEIDEATKKDFIRLVADQASEVAAIVEDLLVAARADTDSIVLMHEEVDLRRAVDSVLEAMPPAIRERFDVSGTGIACGDAQRIRQIVRNLVTNAVRYGELPATVTITANSGDVSVAVSDKGEGIEPAMIERVFQPYQRGHASVTQPNSVGLGLSVSRWLSEKMGGSLVYENETMSTFTLRLPSARCG
jgi:two-component system, OmpR family, phosphate regulon sensor histidine kinase PhoR